MGNFVVVKDCDIDPELLPEIKAKRKAYKKKWYAENQQKAIEYAREYRAENPEKISESYKDWASKNTEYNYERGKKYRNENKEKVAKNKKKWDRENPEAYRAYNANRRAHKINNGGTYNSDDVLNMFKMQKGKCIYCKKSLGESYHVDHYIPLSKGGKNDKNNLQLLCGYCNRSKKDKDPFVFAKKLGMLF